MVFIWKRLLCYNFSISNDLTEISDCDSHCSALLDLFISSEASICSTMVFPPLRNSDHVVVSVPIDFPSNSHRDAPFHCIALAVLVLIGTVFVII